MQVQVATLAAISPVAQSQSGLASLEFLSPEPVRGGCGYFDSSFELSQGLSVTEELDPTLLQLWARVLGGAVPMTTMLH
ncbi:MAG: hypothetical protein IV107_12330 [Paucibacter sp.]|nr:hypothetical protein [Roseateles sp.]